MSRAAYRALAGLLVAGCDGDNADSGSAPALTIDFPAEYPEVFGDEINLVGRIALPESGAGSVGDGGNRVRRLHRLRRMLPLVGVTDVQSDPVGQRLRLLAALARGLLAIDLAHGDREYLSGPARGAGPGLERPISLAPGH